MTHSLRTSLSRLRRLSMRKGRTPRKVRNINSPRHLEKSWLVSTRCRSADLFNDSRGTWLLVTQDEGKGPRKVRVMKVLLRRISGVAWGSLVLVEFVINGSNNAFPRRGVGLYWGPFPQIPNGYSDHPSHGRACSMIDPWFRDCRSDKLAYPPVDDNEPQPEFRNKFSIYLKSRRYRSSVC